MEYIRDIRVTIEIDTNKATTKIELVLGQYEEDENWDDFIERVKQALENDLINR